MKKIYEEHKYHKASVVERIVMNYLTTNRSIRDLAVYYGVPKSTIHDWMKESEDLLNYDLTRQIQSTADMHKRWNFLNMAGKTNYWKLDGDGPLD